MPLSIETLYLRSKVPLKIQQMLTSLSSGLNVAGDMLVHPPHFGYTVRTVPYFKMNLNAFKYAEGYPEVKVHFCRSRYK